MNQSRLFFGIFTFLVFSACQITSTHAAIAIVDDVLPNTANLWNSFTDSYVGITGTGSVEVTDGDQLASCFSYIGSGSGSSGTVTIDGNNSTWTNTLVHVGRYGSGTLDIANGGTVSNTLTDIGSEANSSGKVTLDGIGSNLFTSDLRVGLYGAGTLEITNGGTLSSLDTYIGKEANSSGKVTVDGTGSNWKTYMPICVGQNGAGTLDIRNNGLVGIMGMGQLTIDDDENGDSFIHMSTGGMLALSGNVNTLTAFFGLIEGTDAIQWWDPAFGDWNSLMTATMNEDYTLEYCNTGELAGTTILTVNAVPEPGSVALLLTLFAVGLVIAVKKRR